MVDMVVHRHKLRATHRPRSAAAARAPRRCRRPATATARVVAGRAGERPRSRPTARHRSRASQPWSAHDAILERLPRAASAARSTCRSTASSGCSPQLGHPQRRLPPVIHVAGTNGKGSTIAFLRAMLEAAGKAVHVYTSPHLVRFHERIRLGAAGGGRFVDEDELDRRADRAARRANAGEPITLFEITTAAAFQLFAEHPADVPAARGRPRRPVRRHQRHRPTRSASVITPIAHRPRRSILGDTRRADRRREGRHPQARPPGGRRAAARRGARR